MDVSERAPGAEHLTAWPCGGSEKKQRINGAAMSKLVAGLAVHEDLGVTEVGRCEAL